LGRLASEKKGAIFIGGAEIVLNGLDDIGLNILFLF
jgi:hypothetical protein